MSKQKAREMARRPISRASFQTMRELKAAMDGFTSMFVEKGHLDSARLTTEMSVRIDMAIENMNGANDLIRAMKAERAMAAAEEKLAKALADSEIKWHNAKKE